VTPAPHVAQIPQHHRPGVVDHPGNRCQVKDSTAPVRHMREADQRGLGTAGGERDAKLAHAEPGVDIAVYEPQLKTPLTGNALENVAVGREIVVIGDDDRPARACVQRGARQLVQVDRGVVTDQDLASRRAQQVRTEQVADPHWQADPAVPRADQAGTPLIAHYLADPLGGGAWQPAEGIAVEVDQPGVIENELFTQAGQRVGGI
jgi:hypothetical protein